MVPYDLDLELAVDPASVPHARRAVERRARDAGACPGTVHALRLAVSEACTNVVQHAYAGREHGRFRLQAGVEDRILRVAICDEGKGVRPRRDSPGMGLGLPLMAYVADELTIRKEPDATRIELCFKLDQPPAAFAAAA